MSVLEVQNVVVRRGNWQGQFSFAMEAGEWVSIIGPSGSGKSSLLEIVAGFLSPEEGKALVNGEDVSLLPPSRRGVGYVFQANSLFPHLTLEKNLLLAFHDSPFSTSEKKGRVRDVCRKLRLSEIYLKRYPSEISGGELARFNLARTLLRPAPILLLDEPFSSLDEGLRFEMNALVRALHDEQKLTTICVTHHQEDALLFSDKVMVMKNGRVLALLPPWDLARNPPSVEVAEFLRSGTLYHLEDETYFLRPGDLRFSAQDAIAFSQPRRIVLKEYRWSSAGTHDTVLEMASGLVFRLPPLADFHGEIFFDAARTPRLQR